MTINKEVIFNENSISLVDDPDRYVMMSCETPLMKKHAELVCHNNGDVLEIGFGMGISANFIQEIGVESHTIVECNPQIYERLKIWASDKKNVNIIYTDWFLNPELITNKKYDGIWYDADCINQQKFPDMIVKKCIKPGGIFTYFSPRGSDNYRFKDKLNRDFIIIDNIEKNKYHNDNKCFYNWVNY
jgi:spermidine synthase